MIAKILSDKRPIIRVFINGMEGTVLVDTGASISLIDETKCAKYRFHLGDVMAGSITGAGGPIEVRHTKDLTLDIMGVKLMQFCAADISSVRDSIFNETGIIINGILGYPQIKQAEMQIVPSEGFIRIGH